MNEIYSLYKTMLLIRRFEERLLAEFSTGKLVGTTHTYTGQEADAAGLFSVTNIDDIVFSNHRCHGHYLAYGGDPYPLAAELMGRATGLVGGRGGSQHIQWKNFYSNGVQGGIVPVAAGTAMAQKVKNTGNISIVFIGDGTLGEGVLYESLNIASLWQLPLLIVVEDNRIAQTTPADISVAGSMAGRFSAFDIQVWECETADVLVVQDMARAACHHVRSGNSPGCLLFHTNRFSAHSKGDDTRSKEDIKTLLKYDPIELHGRRLSRHDIEKAENEVAMVVSDAFSRAEVDPFPTLPVEGE